MFAPFSPRKYKSILRGFYEKDALPGDCHVATLLAMTIFNPQRARGTHRAERHIAFAKGKNIASSLAEGNINKKPLAVARGFQTENYC